MSRDAATRAPVIKLVTALPVLAALATIVMSALAMETMWALLGGAAIAIYALVCAAFLIFMRGGWKSVGVAVASVALTASVWAWHWPLRISYGYARADLERIATRARAGEQIATPLRAGWLTIRKVEIRPRTREPRQAADSRDAATLGDFACLWTDTDPSGHAGFIQMRPDLLQFNLWSHRSMDERWQFIKED